MAFTLLWLYTKTKSIQCINLLQNTFWTSFCLKTPSTRFHLKIRKVLGINFALNSKDVILGHFCSKLWTGFFPEKYFKSIWSLLCHYDFMQKTRKVPSTEFLQNFKNLILGSIWPLFGLKTSKQQFPPKSYIRQFLDLMLQQIEELQVSIFHETSWDFLSNMTP